MVKVRVEQVRWIRPNPVWICPRIAQLIDTIMGNKVKQKLSRIALQVDWYNYGQLTHTFHWCQGSPDGMADTSNNPRQPERAQHSLRCDGILHYLGPATKAGIILQTKFQVSKPFAGKLQTTLTHKGTWGKVSIWATTKSRRNVDALLPSSLRMISLNTFVSSIGLP